MVSETDHISLRTRWAAPPLSEARLGAVLLVVALTAGAAWRLWFASVDDSVYWPDEIYQSLEPAHGLAYGYGIRAWEYIEGARNWFFPGVLAVLFRVFDGVGLDRPAEYLPAFEVLFCLLGVLTAWGCHNLARSLGASAPAAAAAAAIFALAAPMIYFAPRALGETASAAPIVWAFALALRPAAGRRSLAWAASLLGVAVLLRLQNGVFCLGLLGILAGQRRWGDVRHVFAVLTLWAAYLGVLDWVTWGRPFHSALVYLEFNLIDGKASSFGTAPWHYYVETFSTAMPALSAIVALFFIGGYRRAPGLSWTVLVAFVSLWPIPHKEFRFVVPALPLFCAVAALGVDRAGARLQRWGGAPTLATAVTAVTLVSAADVTRLTFGDLGQITYFRTADTPALDNRGAFNRLLVAASERPDLCGVFVSETEKVWLGGYAHLHRNVPLFALFEPTKPFNYAVTRRDPGTRPPGLDGQVVVADGVLALVRLERPHCRA
ncbi:MAG: hypothetical protein KY446_03735 [Proteobacteria bacterium]|nr:hypothetical protein [Pseudomonadota bacterium]